MRIYTLLASAMLLSAPAVYAQTANYGYENRFRDNWFVAGAAGVNALNVKVGSFDSPATFALDVNFGKWFSPMFGARVGWQGLNIRTQEAAYGYNYVHGDLLWDLIGTFDHYRQGRIYTLAPYVNVGMVLNTYSDSKLSTRGFGAGVGLVNSFRITPYMSAYLDLRATMLSERAVRHPAGKALMTSAMAGLQFDLGRSDWDPVPFDPAEREAGRLINKGFWNDWFITAGGGVDFVTNGRRWTGYPAGTAEFGVGKWFSSYAGARLAVQGLGMRQNVSGDKYSFSYLHADLLWNWTNTFCKTNGWHLWTAAPYLHLGVFNSMEYMGPLFKNEFAAGAGLYNAFAVSPHLDIFADIRGTLINGRSVARQGGMLLQASVLAGLTYNFDERTLLYVNPERRERENVVHVRSGIDSQNNGFAGNWSIYAAGGVNMLSRNISHPSGLGWRPTFDVGVMKMFSPGFGARLGFQANSLETTDGNRAWQFVHGDVLWDLRGSIAGYDPERIWSISPYLSMGVSFLHNDKLSIRPAAGAGLLNSFRLTDRLGLFLDIRGLILSERQLGASGGYALETSATAGLAFELGKNWWDNNGDGTYLNGLWDNWFFQSSGGFSLVLDTWQRFNGRPAPAMELAVGKWFSPQWGTRLGLLYENMAKDNGNEYDSAYIHGDLLWNFSNTVAGFRSDRVYSAIPYVHFGVMGSWNHFGERFAKDYATGVGLLNDFRVDDKMSFIVDLRGRAMFGRMTGKPGGKALGGEVLMGLSYNLGKGGWEPQRHPESERGPLAISTNIVDWVDLATINFSVEYAFARHWSADIVYGYNGWDFKDGALKDKRRSVTVGVRYWPWHSYSGAWIRPFLGAESSDASGLPLNFLNGTCDRFGAGFSAGYSLMLAKHLNLDFGVGFWGGARHNTGSAQLAATPSSWGAFIAPKDIRISLMFVL